MPASRSADSIGQTESERGPTSSGATAEPGWKRALREPLLHFLFFGAALFVAYSYSSSDEGEDIDAIVVSAGKIEHLAALFTRTWQRPPTRKELEGLVDDFVREEAAYREGTSIGLDRNDTIIRRRIRQKLDFVAGDLASQLDPTDEELQGYLDEHSDDFRLSSQFTFRQVYVNPERHDTDPLKVATELVATLRESPTIDAREQGDRTLLDFQYDDVSARRVASQFGEKFAAELDQIEPGKWHGPIESAYGFHAVFIDQLQPGSLPDLQDVRDAVQREWEHERRQELMETYYQGLLKKYEVIVEWPELDGEIE